MPGNVDLITEAKRLTAAERRPKVVALRRQGLSVREIAARFNVSHVTVVNDLHAAYTRFAEQESAETALLRQLETLRLDRLQQAVWPAAITGDAQAVQAVVSIIDRRSRLLGLDTPIQLRTLVVDGTQKQVEAIMTRLGERLDEETFKKVLEALA